MNNSESARKLNQAVNNTGRAVGEALSQAKGAFSSFWSTFTTPPSVAVPVTGDNNSKAQVKINAIETDPKEVTDAREGVIENLEKKFHNSELNLKKPEMETTTNPDGIVEIGREAGTLDADNRSNEIIDI